MAKKAKKLEGWSQVRANVRGVNFITKLLQMSMSTDIEDRLRGYLAFTPCMLARQLAAAPGGPEGRGLGGDVRPGCIELHGAVLFADLSGFTKLTERLASESAQGFGAEALCAELDKVVTQTRKDARSKPSPSVGWGGGF